MSMIGNILRVSGTELEAFLENSILLENRIYNTDSKEADPALCDLDKSWDGILYLLTGQTLETLEHPLGRVLFSGQFLNEEQDLGYGPAHYLTAAQVKELSAELAAITPAALSVRFVPKQMSDLGIYPDIWEEEGILDYLLAYFEDIQTTYATAAKNNEAVITFVN